jgi:hypothetical protein
MEVRAGCETDLPRNRLEVGGTVTDLPFART